jgi:hypothetical protein
MPVVFRKLRALAACLAILETRIIAESAASSLPLSHLPKKERLEREETQELGNPKRPSTNTTSTSSYPAGGTKPKWDAMATPPAQTAESPQVCCTLWVLDFIAGHLIGQGGRGLKLATDIFKACIAILGLSTELGTAHKATIHGTSEEVGVRATLLT